MAGERDEFPCRPDDTIKIAIGHFLVDEARNIRVEESRAAGAVAGSPHIGSLWSGSSLRCRS